MRVPRRHVLQQGPVVRALLQTAVLAARRGQDSPPAPELPGPSLTATVPPRPRRLLQDYVRHLGGDPSWYKGTVPAHLFSQWGFPLLARTLRTIPYDLRRVLNGGCRIEMHRPLPDNEPLQLEARLESIDDNGRRAVIANHLITGTASAPRAVEAWMYAVVPLSKKGDRDESRKERPTVPVDAMEISRWRIGPSDAVDFALLTGDFNPVHWLRPYARAAGFKSTILHGFSTLGHAIEGLNRNRFSGSPQQLRSIDVRFVRPLLLPADVGLYLSRGEHAVSIGTAPGAPAVLTGTFEERDDG